MTGQQLGRLRNAVDKYKDSIVTARKELANSVSYLLLQLQYEMKGGVATKKPMEQQKKRLRDEIAILYELMDVLCFESPDFGFNPQKLYADLEACRKEPSDENKEATK